MNTTLFAQNSNSFFLDLPAPRMYTGLAGKLTISPVLGRMPGRTELLNEF